MSDRARSLPAARSCWQTSSSSIAQRCPREAALLELGTALRTMVSPTLASAIRPTSCFPPSARICGPPTQAPASRGTRASRGSGAAARRRTDLPGALAAHWGFLLIGGWMTRGDRKAGKPRRLERGYPGSRPLIVGVRTRSTSLRSTFRSGLRSCPQPNAELAPRCRGSAKPRAPI